MVKKIIAIILTVVIVLGVAFACFMLFGPKTLMISAVDVPIKRTEARGEYYELSSEYSFKFTAKTQNLISDVSSEYDAVLGGNDIKLYFLEVKEGQESVHALSMSDLASSFLAEKVEENTITVRTSEKRPLSSDEFKYGKKMLKFSADYEDSKVYTVSDGSEQKTLLGSDIKAHNASAQYKVYFTLTVNDILNEISETVNLWIVPGANNVTLNVHTLTF